MKLPLDGRCRCDRVRFRITKAPLMTGACHCLGCQRMSSSAYSLTAIVPSDGFTVTHGETVIGGIHGEDGQHSFCAYCMTWLFTRATAMPEIVNVRPTMLDDHAWFSPYMESFTSTKLPFAHTGAEVSYAEFPPEADYRDLMAKFARR